MDDRTRQQLLRINAEFYSAHAAGFDASRGHQPWPGWVRLRDSLPEPSSRAPFRVLDVGCGNARLATFLADSGFALDYIGVDANADLLDAARTRLRAELDAQVELVEHDFLATPTPGASLPPGPFDLVTLFGVLHHVPGADWRGQVVRALTERLRPSADEENRQDGGVLAIAAWQFADRARFDRKRVAWETLPPTLGAPIDPGQLDAGDFLLRFGSDPEMPPRYCHQVSGSEMDQIGDAPATENARLEDLDDYRADGGEGDLNRYRVFRRH